MVREQSRASSRGPGELVTSSWRSKRGQGVLSDVQKALAVVQEGSGGTPEGAGGVGRPSWRSGCPLWWSVRGWEAFQEVWEGSEGPAEGLGGVEGPSKVQEGSGVPPGGPRENGTSS